MRNHISAAAGAACVIVAGVAGCSSPPPREPGALPAYTAQVTVNGWDTGRTDAVSCSQVGSLWTIDTGDTAAGTTAVVEAGNAFTAKSVQIRNLAGFSGSYWDGHGGNADASIVGNIYVLSGTIDGFNVDDPTKPATGTFKIRANC